jgi:hypothetical protein
MNGCAAKPKVDLDLEFPIDPTFDPPKPRMTLDEYADFCSRFAHARSAGANTDEVRCFVQFEIK